LIATSPQLTEPAANTISVISTLKRVIESQPLTKRNNPPEIKRR
jgi:hypothetical protein